MPPILPPQASRTAITATMPATNSNLSAPQAILAAAKASDKRELEMTEQERAEAAKTARLEILGTTPLADAGNAGNNQRGDAA